MKYIWVLTVNESGEQKYFDNQGLAYRAAAKELYRHVNYDVDLMYAMDYALMDAAAATPMDYRVEDILRVKRAEVECDD